MNKPTVVKVVLLGVSGVGKSSIIYRYVTDGWDENQQTTLGAAFMIKQVDHRGIRFKFHIWDTAGQEKYASLAQMYYRDAHVAVLVYDVTNRESFTGLKEWHEELKEKGPKDISIAVVGNKCDLNEQVSNTEAERYARSCDALFMRTSAKENIGIADLFESICNNIIENRNIEDPGADMTKSKLKNKTENEKKCCG